MGYRIVVTFPATNDLREIVHYVSEYDVSAAHRFRAELLNAVKLLRTFPQAGRTLPKFHDPALRELIRRPYRIVYRIKDAEQVIEILRFWHAARGNPRI